jgi:hypothetical protein
LGDRKGRGEIVVGVEGGIGCPRKRGYFRGRVQSVSNFPFKIAKGGIETFPLFGDRGKNPLPKGNFQKEGKKGPSGEGWSSPILTNLPKFFS